MYLFIYLSFICTYCTYGPPKISTVAPPPDTPHGPKYLPVP